MYGKQFLYGAERPVNNGAIYRATTDVDIMIDDSNLIVEKISKGDFFSVDKAPNILKSKLRFIIKIGYAEEIEVVEAPAQETKKLTTIEALEQTVSEVLNMDSNDIVNSIIDSDSGGSKTIPEVIDGKISKGTSLVRESLELIETSKKESKIDKFRRKHKKSKLEKFREKRDAKIK